MENGLKTLTMGPSPENHVINIEMEISNDSGKENNKPANDLEINGKGSLNCASDSSNTYPQNKFLEENKSSVGTVKNNFSSEAEDHCCEQFESEIKKTTPDNEKDRRGDLECGIRCEEQSKDCSAVDSQISAEDHIGDIKSVEKVLNDDGDEFIITMNNSDESDDDMTLEDSNSHITERITKKTATCNSVNITLPPLPTIINPNQPPVVLPTSNLSKNSVPLVNMYMPLMVTSDSNSKMLGGQNIVKKMTVTSSNLKRHNEVSISSQERSHLPRSFVEKEVSNFSSPQSSEEMITLIKWEVSNRISNHRPKYQQIQPDSELGPLAKFLFDLGNDLVRENVYNDLVRIQTYRKTSGKLSDKETDDLCKLKDVQAELKELVGPIKQNMKYKCKCGFRCESNSILKNHQEYPHVVENDLYCALCDDYKTKQPAAFVFHMEAMHNMRAQIDNRQPFWTCSLCPYENNSKSKLTQHKFRCLKNFSLKTNLSQNSVIGMEVNFCLENVFYKRKENSNHKFVPYNNAASKQPIIAPKPQNISQQNMNLGSSISLTNVSKCNNVRNDSSQLPGLAVTKKINTLINQNHLVLAQNKRVGNESAGFEVCEICGGYVKDRKALRIHFYYAHRKEIPDRAQAPLYCATCFARFWTAQGLQKHLEVHKVTNAAKCLICGHKVPNVLMHMRIVHTKELGTYLAACKCIYCGLICSSKKGLESHMVGAHGIMIKTDSLISPQNKSHKLDTSKGCVCVLCNLQFARNVDLTRHCMKVHHTCMKCGMVVADKVSLDKHTCLKSSKGLRNCELCPEKGFHPAYHVKHIRDKHIKKCSVHLTRIPKWIFNVPYGKLEDIKDIERIETVCGSSAQTKRLHSEVEIIDESDSEKGNSEFGINANKRKCHENSVQSSSSNLIPLNTEQYC